MSTENTRVDIATLAEGTVVKVTLDGGRILNIEVKDPTTGEATLHVAGFKEFAATIGANDSGGRIVAVGDDFKLDLGGRIVSKKVTAVETIIAAARLKLEVSGDVTPEDVAELRAALAGIPGVALLSPPRTEQ